MTQNENRSKDYLSVRNDLKGFNMFIEFNSHVFLMRGDGTSLCIGLSNELYTRITLTSNWIHIPTSGSVIGVIVLQDGTMLGIGWKGGVRVRV
jgi:hypothetical protein